jgi:hypothetical protein
MLIRPTTSSTAFFGMGTNPYPTRPPGHSARSGLVSRRPPPVSVRPKRDVLTLTPTQAPFSSFNQQRPASSFIQIPLANNLASLLQSTEGVRYRYLGMPIYIPTLQLVLLFAYSCCVPPSPLPQRHPKQKQCNSTLGALPPSMKANLKRAVPSATQVHSRWQRPLYLPSLWVVPGCRTPVGLTLSPHPHHPAPSFSSHPMSPC